MPTIVLLLRVPLRPIILIVVCDIFGMHDVRGEIKKCRNISIFRTVLTSHVRQKNFVAFEFFSTYHVTIISIHANQVFRAHLQNDKTDYTTAETFKWLIYMQQIWFIFSIYSLALFLVHY